MSLDEREKLLVLFRRLVQELGRSGIYREHLVAIVEVFHEGPSRDDES